MPIPKSRGKVLRYRNKRIPGKKNKYLVCAVTSKSGKRGGKTVCHVKTKKKKR